MRVKLRPSDSEFKLREAESELNKANRDLTIEIAMNRIQEAKDRNINMLVERVKRLEQQVRVVEKTGEKTGGNPPILTKILTKRYEGMKKNKRNLQE